MRNENHLINGERDEFRHGGVDTVTAANDSPLSAVKHIGDHEDWIAMSDKERERYSADSHEIYGQSSFVSGKRGFFARLWDSIGIWIAIRTGAGNGRNTNEMYAVRQTCVVNEPDEKDAPYEAGRKHSPKWIRETYEQIKEIYNSNHNK